MRIEGQYIFIEHNPEEVWADLDTPEIIATCIPGVEKFEIVGENLYKAKIRIGTIIKGSYNADITVSKNNRSSFVLDINAEGTGFVNFVKLRAIATIKAHDSGALVHWEAEGEVEARGLIAAIGNRILPDVARRLVAQFFKSVEGQMISAPSP
jgi:carbon monoxide dehydrogenase subunit G